MIIALYDQIVALDSPLHGHVYIVKEIIKLT